MRIAIAAIAALLLTSPVASAQQSAGFDAATSLASRIGGEIPAWTNKINESVGQSPLKTYTPTPAELKKAEAALALLTPLQKSIAQKHLRSFTFTDAADFNGQALRSGQGDDFKVDIIFNRRILSESASDFLTRKERQLFDASGSTLSVTVDGGGMDAVAYVMLHEATHLVDYAIGITPRSFPLQGDIPESSHTDFTRGLWRAVRQLAAPYEDPVFRRVNFAPDARMIPISEAKALYGALGRTPAISVYATRSWGEDLAEAVAWRQMEKLGQPYRIEISDGARIVYTYEPLKNPLVRARFDKLKIFDLPDIPSPT